MAKYKDFDDEIIFDSGSSNPVKSVRNKKKKKKTNKNNTIKPAKTT